MSLHAHHGPGGTRNVPGSPRFLRSFAKAALDAGADVFVGHGPHVVRGIEIYDSKPIFYSLGNFVDQRESFKRFPPEIYHRHDIYDYTKPSKVFDGRWTDDEGNQRGDLIDPKWWETVIPVCRFDDGGLSHLDLYPVSLQQEIGRPHRGTPVLATEDHATTILDDVAGLSREFGTEISIDEAIAQVSV
jgi:poly-gamma-glutamate synthesis protein (capsule biosynthesis protein)